MNKPNWTDLPKHSLARTQYPIYLAPMLVRWLSWQNRAIATAVRPDEVEYALARRTAWVVSNGVHRLVRLAPCLRDCQPPTHVVDLSGAFLPGMGTPVVVLLSDGGPAPIVTRFVVTLRGEPCTPPTPEQGFVWQSITRHYDTHEYADEWIRTEDVTASEWIEHVDRLLAHEMGGAS